MTPQNEFLKTTAAVAGAALFAFAVYLLGPSTAAYKPDEQLGEYFFEFDPVKAGSLEIVEYLPETASIRELKVEQDASGRWVIPSHENYPTDAKERLGQAASAIRFVKRGTKITSQRADHESLGVVDPRTENQPGVKGIGARVSVKEGGKEVAAIIVGLPDKDKGDLRYVRIAGQDDVHLAKIDLGRLSTKFEDWIETDLLQMQGFAIRDVLFNNLRVDPTDQENPIKQGDIIKAAYDDKKEPKDRWSLSEMKISAMKKGAKDFQPFAYGPGEALNVEALDGLKTALDDLKIVDVRRKPKELVDLLSGKRQELTQQVAMDLQSRGYFPYRGSLLSKEGEITVAVDGGVKYVLMFGSLAPTETGLDGGERRYLFVRAVLDLEQIPAPVEEKYVPKKTEPPKTEEKPAEPAKTEEAKPAEPAKTEEKKPDAPAKTEEAKPAEPAKTEEKKPEEKSGSAVLVNPSAEGLLAQADGPALPAAAAPAPAAPAAAPATVPAAAPPAAPAPTAEELEKKRIEDLNAQRRKDYEKKIKEAKDRFEKLDRRFNDWYYVIDADVYKKVHLTRAELVSKAGGAGAAAGAGAEGDAGAGDGPIDFKALQQGIDAGK